MAHPFVAEQIALAEKQISEKRAKEAEITATRTLLRSLADNGTADAQQAAKIRELFPLVKRTRGAKDGAKVAA